MARGNDSAEQRVVHEVDGRPAWTPRDDAPRESWFPAYFLLETGAALLVLAGLALLSLTVDAPLLDLADPEVTPDPSKAPWYFVGLQELLHYYPPVVAGAIVPATTVAFAMMLP